MRISTLVNRHGGIGRGLSLLIAWVLSGCFYIGQNDFEDVVQQSSEKWSTRDCLTVILGVTQHNLYDIRSPDIKVIAIPYYPSVIAATTRRGHILGPLQFQPFTYSHTDEMYRHRLDTMMAIESGLYVDWTTGRFVDGHGNYLKGPTQIDSLMFYLSVTNINWPALPELIPDITDLENNIYLINDDNKILKPRYVWGKQRTTLTIGETLLVMFILRSGDYHFLKATRSMRLVINGFHDPIVLEFPLARMR